MLNSYKEAPNFVKTFIDTTIKHEGGDKYTNDPNDSGGETRYGVTKKSTLKYKEYFHLYHWDGNMKTLPLSFAQDLYAHEYFMIPKFNLVAEVSQMIAEELFDTSVNVGASRPSKWLQQLLNVLNNQQKLYKDISEDGFIGVGTVNALKAYLNKRGNEGEKVLYNMMNTLQGNHYIQLAIKREKDEKFVYGQFNGRVSFK
jgi:typhoid toxin secretion A